MNDLRVKQRAAPPPGEDPLEFVMSDGSVDRMGDVIEPNGWKLDNFRSNPVALFGHDPQFPIGQWQDVNVRGGRLTGHLALMEPVSDRLREIHAAVQAGVLRAVSVGFHSQNVEPLEGSKSGGLHFIEAELVECSLVSVPANPNALAVAKALGISREGQRLIFGGPAGNNDQTLSLRGLSGEPARKGIYRKPHQMNQLSERIQGAQNEVVALQDQLTAIVETDDVTKATELADRIEQVRNQIVVWEKAERALASTSEAITVPASRTTVIPPSSPTPQTTSTMPAQLRPFAQPKRKEEPGHILGYSLLARLQARAQGKPVEMVIAERNWSDDLAFRAVLDWTQRAATNVATTNTPTWAQELAAIQYGDYLAALTIASVFQRLSGYGSTYALGRYGQISIPVEQTTPTIAGSFVAEGAPIPVRQGAFTTLLLGLKKMAVITSFTREIFEHSIPTIDSLLRDMITRHTNVALDTILLDTNAATSIRPAGLRAGVSGQTPTAGGGFNALVGDITNLLNVLITSNSLRMPVWIMNPLQAAKIALTQSSAGTGVFPFRAEIDSGTLISYPVITSPTVTAGMIILVDAADFVSLSGDDPRFEVSDQATLHMEDTTPLAIGTPGAPNTVAAPVRSMFQTDSIALRMILPMNWAMRRTGLVAWVTGVTW
jgi:HK97 family phage major capsid protein/HK97 family phage prohead protease